MTKIKELEKVVGKNGYKYHQIAHTSNIAVWEQRDGSRVVAYEVGYRKFRSPNPRFEKEIAYETIESFWADEDFGKKAWTYPDLKTAMEVYGGLL